MNGDSIIGLQIFFNSGAMFRMLSASVGIAPPVFGSRREEIVPPVMTIATFGNCWWLGGWVVGWFSLIWLCGFRTLAERISDSLIPML